MYKYIEQSYTKESYEDLNNFHSLDSNLLKDLKYVIFNEFTKEFNLSDEYVMENIEWDYIDWNSKRINDNLDRNMKVDMCVLFNIGMVIGKLWVNQKD